MAGLLGIAAMVTPGLAVAPVAADCATQATIPDALRSRDTVFVGTVYSLENDNRWATVLVDERWHNADGIPDTVFIHGGPGPNVTGSDQRVYEATRYVFDVTNTGPYFEDSICTATTPWTADLAQYRPTNVAEASGSSSGSPFDIMNSPELVLVAVLILALLIAIVAYILILRRRQRPPDWMR